jgi:hypothetical protein
MGEFAFDIVHAHDWLVADAVVSKLLINCNYRS